ncbi:copper-translocating P-type ATPase [candidate division WWE3 bacterium RIFCSPHIGHO2_12_FULL_38_15]|uniref:Copper-translocating P-type ATPase n=1 Tax=candidate division WWE3 bacterium RIFCSPHIGHO2_02_FULL_38_14 TaxID=1802620 RepID=A0A1F4V887_UNCKA|nr:MAG: copper-translocating P-type ATPase [candidate division WWE3 bacterium RIFCSPHIGHO2_01_FULL_38_45]OGC49556.1 MAG: copper-translocating P-type ATPase [candidate division WWE3 bacterium RIFCSPHIGHO2_12_FULL_38_15]OGC52524.1 MAG: copper-translocating P-type ATPase [candidate division WWE3 bacterium RIFCSPLOWO2_01_FULL_37_24]OGC53366.1 MAG: copper-translocating P-type ATPase [candidate division WWE3 bacterium RIFCSPHIGHO2_02_FULL_38_14]HLB51786.1 copper-translocating P-type ATPase [Patesciba
MHPEVHKELPGTCPKCGMTLVKTETKDNLKTHVDMRHDIHSSHVMKPNSEMSFWEKLKMSMSMTMGMDHTGLAGREMARLMEEDIRSKFFVSLLLTVPIVLFSPLGKNIMGFSLPIPISENWLLLLLTTPVYFYCGWIFLYSTYVAIFKQRTLNMAVLIAVGITAAYVFSIVLTLLGSEESFYEAAAMLITFVLFGHWMEMKSRRGTTDALQALFNLVPPQARVIRNGKEELVPTAEVKQGDILILKPGDKVPVDGEITDGETAIDESLVTGESIPVSKQKGDKVIGGSINTSGSVQFKATKVGKDTALAQIVKMVETAQNSKAPGQKLADKFARYLVVVAVGGGFLTFAVWFFIMGQTLLFALTFAISTVVIACPDALGLATPTAVAVGTGLGAKHNILIKDAPTLEQVSKIQAVVLDKTGTLTEGKPKITDVIAAVGFSEDEVLKLDAAAEAKSSHPLSQAVLEETKKRNIVVPSNVEKFQNLSGHGVEAFVEGKHVLVGTLKLMSDRKVDTSPLQQDIEKLLSGGKTIMVLAVDNKIAGVAAALDPVKENAGKAITRMKELGLEVAMITGDNKKTAESIGKQLGIDRVFSEVLPEDKSTYVKKLQQEGKFVAMVGDGVNDAPALAQADIGIAIGAGTDVAIETAKVVLMKSDPADVLRAIRLSKATVLKMKQNLFWASIYNLLAIPVAAGVLYPSFQISLRPEISALLMSISSIIVATNAVLLKRTEKDLVEI